jgi:hypothetical protein
MRHLMTIALAACSAVPALSSVHAARVTECTALKICYCVETDIKPAIDTNVSKIRQMITEQKNAGKAIGYMSLPISTVGGAYSGINVDVAAKTKEQV